MICEKCKQAGLASRVYPPTASVVTCMSHQPFYDEAGAYHSHDPNRRSEAWSCSNGHRWRHTYQRACPKTDCAWNATRRDETVWEDAA